MRNWLRSLPGGRAGGSGRMRRSSSIPPGWPCRMSPPRRSSMSGRLPAAAEQHSISQRSRDPPMPESKYDEPPVFKVLLHNDDYTTMDFVVHVLESVFNMPVDKAIQVMLNVHVKGIGLAGVYTYEVAEMKVAKTTAMAREHEFPLLCTIEKDQ